MFKNIHISPLKLAVKYWFGKNFKIFEDQHSKVCVDESGGKEKDRWYYIVTNASLIQSVKWRCNYILVDKDN